MAPGCEDQNAPVVPEVAVRIREMAWSAATWFKARARAISKALLEVVRSVISTLKRPTDRMVTRARMESVITMAEPLLLAQRDRAFFERANEVFIRERV